MTDKVVVKVEDKVTTFVTPDQGPVGPSGESLIDGKSVQVSSISDGDVISYSLADNEWQNKTLPAISFTDATTDDLTEGASSLYYTDFRARNAVSADGDLIYNESTGVFSFTQRTDAEVRGLLSATGDLSYNSTTGEFSVTTFKSNDFDTNFSGKTTSDLIEGSNLYYTDARVRNALGASGDLNYNSTTGQFSVTTYKSSDFDTDFDNKSTDNLSEGTNLYYTDARVRAAVSASGSLSYDQNTGVFSYTERTDSQIRGLFSSGGDLSYNATTGEFSVTTYKSSDFDTDFASKTTSDLTEGTNLYYTDARVNSDIDARVNKTFVDALNVNADTLDGQDSVYYLDYNNLNNTPAGLSQFSNDENYIKLTDINVSGDLSYNSSTGEISFTERTDSEVRNLLSASGDLNYNSTTGQFSVTTYKSNDFDTDFGGKSTDNLSEGQSNLYHTTERSRDSISASGDIVYDKSTGVISFSERTSSDVRALFGAEGDLSYDRNSGTFSITKYGSSDFNSDFSSKTTDDLSEGLSSKYYADFRVDSHLSGGTGVTYNEGEISIGQDVNVNSSVSFNSVSAQFIDCGTIA